MVRLLNGVSERENLCIGSCILPAIVFIILFTTRSALDVSEITNMQRLFYRVACSKTRIPGFDPDLSEWKVERVTTMSEMFRSTAFDNESLEDWNVENVVNMNGMVKETDFNNDSLKNWKVDKVVNMNGVFEDSSFNGDLSNWDTSTVEDMTSMFDTATFNNDSIKKWSVENVISFENMFGSNEAFNQDLSKWKVSSAEVFAEMFAGASAFNQQLCWDVSSATDTYEMFRDSPGGLLECCSAYNPIDSGNYKVEELNLIDGECPTKAPSKKSKKNGKRDFMI